MAIAYTRLIPALLLTCTALPASAEALFRLAYDHGGDELAVAYSNGTSDSIRAGTGLTLALGARLWLQEGMSMDMTVGYKFDTVVATNGELDWSIIPIDMILHSQVQNLHLGLGLTYHIDPELTGTGAASHINYDFDNSMGLVMEAGIELVPNNVLGLRFTNIDYTTVSGTEVDADSVGFYWQAQF